MQRRPVSFFSDRFRLDGDLYLPDDLRAGERRPAVVSCSGYQGYKVMHPQRFARFLVPRGYICLAFDYRGHGASEGERGRLIPQEEVEDVRAGVSLLETVAEVDAERIGVLGWALGGGVAITAAADDLRIGAVAVCNAVGDGARSIRPQHDERSWMSLVSRVEEDRRQRVISGRSQLVPAFDIVRLDRDTATDGYCGTELAAATQEFGSPVSLEAADFMLRFRPEDVVHRIAPRPLLLVHGAVNRLHSPDESRELYRRAGEPKRLELLADSGHTEWMHDDHPTFRRFIGMVADFFDTSIGAAVTGGATA